MYGDSPLSEAGNGAVIWVGPDAPLALLNDPATTTDAVIRFTWTAGANDGGSAVTGHTIYWDQGAADGNFILLASSGT